MPHHKDKSKPTRTTLKIRRTNPDYNKNNKEFSFIKLMKINPYKMPKIKSAKPKPIVLTEENIKKKVKKIKEQNLPSKRKVVSKEPKDLKRNIIL